MKKILLKLRKQRIVKVLLILTFLIFTMCVTITNITQPTTAGINQQIDITVDLTLDPEVVDDEFLILGFLAPMSWNVEGTGVAIYTSSLGNGTMSLAPIDELAPNSAGDLTWANEMEAELGIGANSGDVKWVVYKSDLELVVTDDSVDVTGQIQFSVSVGSDNVITQLGYAVTLSNYGVKVSNAYHDVSFTACMEITGGPNAAIDLCSGLGVDNQIASEIRFYPNPFDTVLSVVSQSTLTHIEIYSMLGKKIKNVTSNFDSITTNDMKTGVYIIKAFSDRGITSKILIKE
jgi:hypothetical protein